MRTLFSELQRRLPLHVLGVRIGTFRQEQSYDILVAFLSRESARIVYSAKRILPLLLRGSGPPQILEIHLDYWGP
jgi:hypothetical protein